VGQTEVLNLDLETLMMAFVSLKAIFSNNFDSFFLFLNQLQIKDLTYNCQLSNKE
jgi:hypothetical protein